MNDGTPSAASALSCLPQPSATEAAWAKLTFTALGWYGRSNRPGSSSQSGLPAVIAWATSGQRTLARRYGAARSVSTRYAISPGPATTGPATTGQLPLGRVFRRTYDDHLPAPPHAAATLPLVPASDNQVSMAFVAIYPLYASSSSVNAELTFTLMAKQV